MFYIFIYVYCIYIYLLIYIHLFIYLLVYLFIYINTIHYPYETGVCYDCYPLTYWDAPPSKGGCLHAMHFKSGKAKPTSSCIITST